MQRNHDPFKRGPRKKIGGWIAISCLCLGVTIVLAFAVTVVIGQIGDADPVSAAGVAQSDQVSTPNGVHNLGSDDRVSTRERVLKHEALPCTGLKDPIDFEVFSAGPSVSGVPLNSVQRRCGGSTSVNEPPANFINYVYGHCEIAEGATGCEPPLEIQTWPACQRALGDYSFEGKPPPYKKLPSRDGAEVVEINFMLDHRIEVYSKSSTIVIFAEDPALANEALVLLRSQEINKPPATQAKELEGEPEEGLGAPSDGAIGGELPC